MTHICRRKKFDTARHACSLFVERVINMKLAPRKIGVSIDNTYVWTHATCGFESL